jgi:SAM-dependent methyltransferase
MDEHVPLYTSSYGGFGVREQVRHATYGDDVGQSGWITADELERFGEWLELREGSRLLDVGCGSGGPALRLAETTGASVVGIDLLDEGIAQATHSPYSEVSPAGRDSPRSTPPAACRSPTGASTP